jgi:hypothetical protein
LHGLDYLHRGRLVVGFVGIDGVGGFRNGLDNGRRDGLGDGLGSGGRLNSLDWFGFGTSCGYFDGRLLSRRGDRLGRLSRLLHNLVHRLSDRLGLGLHERLHLWNLRLVHLNGLIRGLLVVLLVLIFLLRVLVIF